MMGHRHLLTHLLLLGFCISAVLVLCSRLMAVTGRFRLRFREALFGQHKNKVDGRELSPRPA